MDKKTIRKRKRGFISFLLSLVLAVQCFAVSASAEQHTITVTGTYDNWNYSGINVGSVLKNGDTLTRAAGPSVDSTHLWEEQFSITYNDTAGTQLGYEYESSTINNSNYKHWKVTHISMNSGAQFGITLKGMLTVEFDSQGGSAVADIPTDPNQSITKPADPTKEHCTFGGWYKEADCINAWNFSSDKVTEDITLYAKWIPAVYGVTLDTKGGTINGDPLTEYTYGMETTLPEDVTKTGHTFGGWYDNNDFTGNPVESITPTDSGDKTYWAKWTANTYTVTLDPKGGTINGNVTSYTYGIGATLPTNVTMTGHTFGGWYDNNDLIGTAVTAITPTDIGNKKFWAKWTPINYTITWKNYDNSTLKTDTVPYGETPSYGTPAPTKPETAEYTYTFSGWTPAVSSVTGDASYTAQYTEEGKTYSVKLDPKGGTINGNVTSYTYGIGATLPTGTNVTKIGHTFGGWYANEEFNGNPVTAITTTDIEDKEFWAKWTANNYAVTLNTNGGTINGNVTSYTYGEGATLPADVTKTGHTFGGWYANEEFTGNPVFAITSTDIGNKEFWAKWTANTYNVTFNSNGGNDVTPTNKNVTYGEAYGELPQPTRDGYNFLFWSTQETGGTQITADSTVTTASAHTLYAQWNPIGGVAYKVLHYKQNVSGSGYYLADTDNLNGAAFSTVTPAVKQYTGFDSPAAVSTTISFDGSTVVAYTYTRKTYTVTFVSDGGSQVPQQSVKYEANAEKPADPVKEGCTFAGWYIGETAFNFASPITGDTTLTAKWTANKYTIKFVNYDGTVLQSSDYEYGAVPAYNGAVPTKPDDADHSYVFIGWDKELSKVTEDAAYTAAYNTVKNKYTITFVNYDGTVLQSSDYEYGAVPVYTGSVPSKASDANDPYIFSGWDKAIVPVTGDAEYTAVFSRPSHYPPSSTVTPSVSKYTVTWKNYDGTVLETDTGVPYGSYPSYDGAIPTKEADGEYTYNFEGWTPDISYVSRDVTYTAQFSETALPVSPEEDVPEEDVSDAADDADSIEADDDNDESDDTGEAADDTDSIETDDDNDESEDTDEEEDVIGYYVSVTPTDLSDSVFGLVMKEAGKNGKTAEKDLCWDIRLFRTVNGETEKQLHESKRPIKVEVSLTPEQIQLINKYDSFNIVRVHNGKVELLECVYDKQKGVLIFESDRFSDYALIHEPKHIEQEVTESDDNPGTGTADSTLCFAVLISAAVLILSRKRRA